MNALNLDLTRKCQKHTGENVLKLYYALNKQERKKVHGYTEGAGSWNLKSEEGFQWNKADIIRDVIDWGEDGVFVKTQQQEELF